MSTNRSAVLTSRDIPQPIRVGDHLRAQLSNKNRGLPYDRSSFISYDQREGGLRAHHLCPLLLLTPDFKQTRQNRKYDLNRAIKYVRNGYLTQ